MAVQIFESLFCDEFKGYTDESVTVGELQKRLSNLSRVLNEENCLEEINGEVFSVSCYGYCS